MHDGENAAVGRILVVDDETSMQDFLQILLQREGHEVSCCGTASEALVALESDDYDLVISDIRMPGMDGMELLDHVQRLSAETLVILITAHGTTESAVEAMKRGAYDYLTKPCSVDELRLVVQKALEKRDLSSENRRLRRQLGAPPAAPPILGRSSRMQEVLGLVRQVAPTRTNVLITGESGTGKELVARAVHALSDRRDKPFVAVNCGAIPENLLESELFGHVRGSFTGATANKMGLFEIADGGTLFLDEIGEMPLPLQVKVLRAIQQRTFKRVGGTSDIRVDVRIVCATNRILEEDVRLGRFREDLFYRLNVIEIHLPPLRERPEDIPELVRFFVHRYAEQLGRAVEGVDPEVMAALESYPYQGNVRELENLIERAVTLTPSSRIRLDCLPPAVREPASARGANGGAGRWSAETGLPPDPIDLERILADYERSLLAQALERCGGVKKRAAALLGISFRSLRYRLEKLGMDSGDAEPG
jgi:two-component system response regulator PilR (NtrC family)